MKVAEAVCAAAKESLVWHAARAPQAFQLADQKSWMHVVVSPVVPVVASKAQLGFKSLHALHIADVPLVDGAVAWPAV